MIKMLYIYAENKVDSRRSNHFNKLILIEMKILCHHKILIAIKMKLILLFLFFVNGLAAQNSNEFIERVQNYQKSVRLIQGRKYPDSIDTTTFNLNKYLRYFDKLKFPAGLRCHYVFEDHTLGGSPILYFKSDSLEMEQYIDRGFREFIQQSKIDKTKITQEFIDTKKYYILCGFASSHKANGYIRPEDNETGYLQYLFFNQFGEQFALKWHSYYGQKSVIFSKNEMKRLFNYYSKTEDYSCKIKDFKKLLKVDPRPVIEMGKDKCVITWYEIYTHAGIHRRRYEISRLSPFHIEVKEDVELVEFKSEFIY